MRIGVIGAMLEEIELVKQEMKIEKVEEIGKRSYYIGELYGKDAVLVFSRYGKVAAASTVTTLIEKFNVDMIVFTGVAGAVAKELHIGDIVIADRLIQHDMDITPLAPELGRFYIPLINKDYFEVPLVLVRKAVVSADKYIKEQLEKEVSKELLKEFQISIPHIATGTIASGDQFIADSGKIHELDTSIANLKCVEMEGAAVAQVCYEHDIPCAVIRVMSDNADEHADINFARFVEKAASYFTRGVIRELIRNI
jgi:adenosylhomocysteine nucleosidase